MLNRRVFLERTLSFGSLVLVPRIAWTQGGRAQPGARTLVMLHLVGGNDGLNTVVPYTDPLYRLLRPSLGIEAAAVRKVERDLGFHPALAGFEQLYSSGRLAVINGVGYPNPDFSHFRATEIYHSAHPEQTPTTGWLGRALELRRSTQALRAVALQQEKPLALACSAPGIVALTRFRQFELPPDDAETIRMYEQFATLPGPRGEVARRALEAFRVAAKLAKLQALTGNGLYGTLGADLGHALALLRTDLDLEVIWLSFGGFDTHANQAGQHSELLTQVGANLRAYQDLLERSGIADRVVTCVFSEFGRRASENLSGGTDHGAAYPAFVLGAGLRAGMHGATPRLDDLDGDNLKYTTDFRRLYAALLARLGVDPRAIVGDHEPLELFT